MNKNVDLQFLVKQMIPVDTAGLSCVFASWFACLTLSLNNVLLSLCVNKILLVTQISNEFNKIRTNVGPIFIFVSFIWSMWQQLFCFKIEPINLKQMSFARVEWPKLKWKTKQHEFVPFLTHWFVWNLQVLHFAQVNISVGVCICPRGVFHNLSSGT